MRLLIDGYNVLHQSGLLGKGSGGVWLERGRKRLLDLLRAALDSGLLPKTHVVFDAYSSSSITTEITSYQEIKVHFSLGYENADELIEKLIREHHAPKSLTVVSSDHRIQRCAKAHRCRIYDSATWLDELPRNQHSKNDSSYDIKTPREQHVAQGLSNYEVQLWLKEFGIKDASETISESEQPKIGSTAKVREMDETDAAGKRGRNTKSPGKPEGKTAAKEKLPPKSSKKTTKKAPEVKVELTPRKSDKAKSLRNRGEKKDLPRARKRAARPLPDGFRFPDVEE